MKIIHTADLHLGKRLHQHSLLPDQKHVLEQMVAHVTERHPDLFIVAGDVFDRSLPPEDAMDLFGQWLSSIRDVKPHLPIVIIAGNHDSGKRLAWASKLLKHDKIYLRGVPKTVESPIQFTTMNGIEVEVWALPFAWAGDFPQPDGEVATQSGAFSSAIDFIQNHRDDKRKQILVAHCFAQGGLESQSERQLLGQATLVETQLFEGFDYVALGHLHRSQKVANNAWYSGSPLAYSFNENSDDKSILLVDISSATPVVERIALQPLRHLRLIEDKIEALLDTSIYDHYKDDYLSVQLTEHCAISDPMHHIRTRFQHVLNLRVPREEEPEHGFFAGDQFETGDLADDLCKFWQHVTGNTPTAEVLDVFNEIRPDGSGE